MSAAGRIHSFETFGTLDGPGIRFVVFLQGCPLRCLYCHNRDTWDVRGGREYTVGMVMDELKKYTNYIRFSGGGITVSGGEPTMQPAFVAELFESCRRLNIHTALDTSGHADAADVGGLLEYTDLVLLDIKHIRDEKHRLITGAGFDKTERFARRVSDAGIPLWIRYVLAPGLTDDEEDLHAAAEFIKSLGSVQKIEVLPYHGMGAYKWEKLGKAYPLSDMKEPSEESLEKARRILDCRKG
jgi:pyruvate formate lyase activating enzyme